MTTRRRKPGTSPSAAKRASTTHAPKRNTERRQRVAARDAKRLNRLGIEVDEAGWPAFHNAAVAAERKAGTDAE